MKIFNISNCLAISESRQWVVVLKAEPFYYQGVVVHQKMDERLLGVA
jgi:hypothetical protein